MYLDERPETCEGCHRSDHPQHDGSRQIVWNNVLSLWLCHDCRNHWAEWMGRCYPTSADRAAHKPGFLKLRDQPEDDEPHIIRGLE